MPVVMLSEGAMFAGRYQIVRCIAAGGMGAVYEVIHVETERHRALKVMLPHLVESDDMRERFRREARVAAKVESAYIVDVFDAGIDETTRMPFLVMELLKGEELGNRLRRVGKFGFAEVVGYLWQTALALDKTHRANIVHRDLKPENLFLCEDDDGPPKIKVLDFGIAKIIAEGGTAANATQAMGTPLYMAPEQFKSKSKVSPATDIYSLGMMAYTLLVGAPYWADEQASEANAYAFVGLVMGGPPDPPTVRALRQGFALPAAFDEWFTQATAPVPERRFLKATVAIKELATALGVPVPGTFVAPTAGSAEPLGTVDELGQTLPGQLPPGPSGRMEVLTKVAEPSAAVESSTNASGYGLSSTQFKVASVPSLPRMDTPNPEAQAETPKRGKTLPVMITAAVVLCAVGIGIVSFGTKNEGPTAKVATAVPDPVPNATTAAPVVSTVAPIETAKAAESVPLAAPAVDAGTHVDSGTPLVNNTKATPLPLATSKKTPSTGTTVKPKNTDHIRD